MISTDLIKQRILEKLPGAEVEVTDMTGTRDHFEVKVSSEAFKGKPLIDQHRIIFGILEPEMKQDIHALKLQTRIPI